MIRNYIFLIKKNTNKLNFFKPALWQIANEIKKYDSLSGNRPAQRAICQGIWDGFLMLGGEYRPSKIRSALGYLVFNLFKFVIKLNDTIKIRKIRGKTA